MYSVERRRPWKSTAKKSSAWKVGTLSELALDRFFHQRIGRRELGVRALDRARRARRFAHGGLGHREWAFRAQRDGVHLLEEGGGGSGLFEGESQRVVEDEAVGGARGGELGHDLVEIILGDPLLERQLEDGGNRDVALDPEVDPVRERNAFHAAQTLYRDAEREGSDRRRAARRGVESDAHAPERRTVLARGRRLRGHGRTAHAARH